MKKAAEGLDGIQHAVQRHVQRQAGNEDKTVVVGYQHECDLLVYAARGFDQFRVALCPGVEGKQLARRLDDVARHNGKERYEAGHHLILTRRIRHATTTLMFGSKNCKAPEDGVVICSDFPTADEYKVHHCNTTGEPSNKSTLEPRGPLPRSLSTFMELAENMAKHFVQSYGTFYEEQLLSTATDPRGVLIGLLSTLKYLHRQRSTYFTEVDVVCAWEESFCEFRTELLQRLTGACLTIKKDPPRRRTS